MVATTQELAKKSQLQVRLQLLNGRNFMMRKVAGPTGITRQQANPRTKIHQEAVLSSKMFTRATTKDKKGMVATTQELAKKSQLQVRLQLLNGRNFMMRKVAGPTGITRQQANPRTKTR